MSGRYIPRPAPVLNAQIQDILKNIALYVFLHPGADLFFAGTALAGQEIVLKPFPLLSISSFRARRAICAVPKELMGKDPRNNENNFYPKKEGEKPDGRRDVDGDWGKKTYRGVREDGSPWEKVTSWFGNRLHLIVDSNYELPVHFSLTKASNSEVKQAHGMIDDLADLHPMLVERCNVLTADRGYDDGKLVAKLWDEHGIKPVIDIRNCWQDQDPTRLLGNYANVVHDYKGTIYCHCPEKGIQREMAFGGRIIHDELKTGKYKLSKALCVSIDFECGCY